MLYNPFKHLAVYYYVSLGSSPMRLLHKSGKKNALKEQSSILSLLIHHFNVFYVVSLPLHIVQIECELSHKFLDEQCVMDTS
jgi:hypothetical protein